MRNARTYRRRWGSWPMEGWLAELADLGLLRWSEDEVHVTAT